MRSACIRDAAVLHFRCRASAFSGKKFLKELVNIQDAELAANTEHRDTPPYRSAISGRCWSRSITWSTLAWSLNTTEHSACQRANSRDTCETQQNRLCASTMRRSFRSQSLCLPLARTMKSWKRSLVEFAQRRSIDFFVKPNPQLQQRLFDTHSRTSPATFAAIQVHTLTLLPDRFTRKFSRQRF